MVNLSHNIHHPPICFSLLIIFLFRFHHLFPIPVSCYTPIENFAIDCGFSGTSYTTPSDNRIWTPDDVSKIISLRHNTQTSVAAAAVLLPSSFQKTPYATARLSHSEFTYSFKVTDGQKFVRLFFYPASYANFHRSNALFSVRAGHHTLLKDFNASLTADNDDDPSETVFREYCVIVEPGHRLNITFTPSTTHLDAYAFINGIEVVSMPTHLYYKNADAPASLKIVGSSNRIQVDSSAALEMVYRINVGEAEIPAHQDTGMLRHWDADAGRYGHAVMERLQNLKPDQSDANLTYPDDIQKDAAPKEVYSTARTSKENMTWEFGVDSMFAYMIRLHFCELNSEVHRKERVFQIHIADTLAEPQVDVIGWRGRSLVPIYKDYVVLLNEGSLKRLNLSIKLQKLPRSKYDDVILNGIEIFKFSDSHENLGGPDPDKPSSPSKPSKSSKKIPKTLLVVACAAVGIIVLSAIGFLLFRRMMRARVNKTAEKSLDSCRNFSIAEIRAATNDFDDVSIIGRGGFGVVYRGNVDKGKTSTPVAIKRLKPDSDQGVDEFQTEINLLSQFRHRHLVPLIGYCKDGKELILVYEFMARGTLSEHLYKSDNQPLSWRRRLEICMGAAEALLYLHTNTGENKKTVIHRDVKSSNILLDEDWVAKVSDFGLSRIGPTGLSRSHITTMAKGSIGYIDPEYYESQQLTPKSDVYSFGVVLLEVLCGRPPVLRSVEKQEGCLVDWVRKCYEKEEIEKAIDPFLKGIAPRCLNKFVQIALACLHVNGRLRPSMRDVVRGLETVLRMQGGMEGEILRDGKAKSEDATNLNRFRSDGESDVQFSTSDGSVSTTESRFSSKVTIRSTEEEQALVPAGVFSELANPTAR